MQLTSQKCKHSTREDYTSRQDPRVIAIPTAKVEAGHLDTIDLLRDLMPCAIPPAEALSARCLHVSDANHYR